MTSVGERKSGHLRLKSSTTGGVVPNVDALEWILSQLDKCRMCVKVVNK